ncbi:MAG: hypothetical protein ACRCST_16160 [Turicibacter sp.]
MYNINLEGMKSRLSKKILETQTFILLDLIKWKIVDGYRAYKNRNDKKIHLFGISMYCGLYGQGKTMALTEYLERMRNKYGDKIYISTNYFYEGQDFPLTHWKDLMKEYDKPIIFGYDEIQNEFNSRDYQNFPYELLTLLTQNRKGNGKKIVCTAQRFVRVDKIFRELCTEVVECKTRFGRLTSLKSYDWEDYEQLLKTPIVSMKMKIHTKWRKLFVQTDYIRGRYNSYQMLESAKSKEYISTNEQVQKFKINVGA